MTYGHDNSDSYGTAADHIISVASRRAGQGMAAALETAGAAGQGVAAVIDSFQEAGASVLQSAMSLLPGQAVTGGRRMDEGQDGDRSEAGVRRKRKYKKPMDHSAWLPINKPTA